MLFFPMTVFSHSGSHGNDDCTLSIGDTEIRFNGYQFQGSAPDRHYCRHFPYLGQSIIKIDSVTADLTDMGIELQLLKRNSWLGLMTNAEHAFSIIKQQKIQYFSKQVVSIDADLQERDVYAVKMRLHAANGAITEQQFIFVVGFPFAQIMVAIAVLLLLLLIFIVVNQWLTKR